MKDAEEFQNLERIEDIINWTLRGLTMYYRDSHLPQDVIAKYEPGIIFRSPTFVDVSSFAGKCTSSCRFVFATSKAAPFYQINPETKKWGFHAINCNSYFKVLDVYDYEGVKQVFLLHIPYKAINLFSQVRLKLGSEHIEEQIIERARASLRTKMIADVSVALQEEAWIKRTSAPIGLDREHHFYPLEPTESLMPMAEPMSNAIRKMTNDLSDLNVVSPMTKKPLAQKKARTKQNGFWSKLFGKS